MGKPECLQELFTGRHFDREIIILRVRWYLRFKRGLRDLVERWGAWPGAGAYHHHAMGQALHPGVREALAPLCPCSGPIMARGRECAAASGVRDGGRSPATGLQQQIANHRKRRGSKARIVSVEGMSDGRTVNCRLSVENREKTSKPAGLVTLGSA
jgi:hypothetical protein